MAKRLIKKKAGQVMTGRKFILTKRRLRKKKSPYKKTNPRAILVRKRKKLS